MNRIFRKIVSVLASAAFIATMIPSGINASAVSTALPLYLTKTAVQKAGTTDEWNVTLTVSGSSQTQKTTSDIVVVLDASGSMYGNAISKAKAGAKSLVSTVLAGNKSTVTRVAAVAYSTGIDDFCALSNSAADVNAKIDTFRAGGATNTQAGIHKAEQLLAGSTATNKIIVLLSDGDPTLSYKAANAVKYTGTTNPFVSFGTGNHAVTRHSFSLTNFDYNSVVGSGSSYGLGSDSYNARCTADNTNVRVSDNGIAAISEALAAKASGIGIYTIGYNLKDKGDFTAKYVMRNIASDAASFYNAKTTNIATTFADIAGSIENKISATASNVIDIVGSNFDLVADTLDADSGRTATSSTDSSGRETITWDTGNINTSVKTLTYTVRLKDNGATGVLPTNESAVISYTDSNGNSATGTFPVPTVSVYSYNVNYIKDGATFNTVSGRLATGSTFTADVAGNLPAGYSMTSVTDASGTAIAPDTGGNYSKTVTGTNASNVINVYYTRNNYGYTVNYLEQGTNNVLHAAKTGTAAFGSTVTESSIAIDGYTAVTASGTVVISSTATNNVINLYYTKNDYGYTVNYLEQSTNNVLHAAKTGTAAFGSTVTESSIAIDGYTAVAASGTVVISSTATNNVINLYYTKNDYGYTVNYLEQGTNNVLHAAKTGTAAFGSTVTESSIAIDGYTAVAASGTVVISSTAANNVINLYYTKNDYGYTVNYLEQGTNNVLHAAKTGTAAFGSTVTESSIAIDGYTAVTASGTVVISSTATNNVINLYYTKNDYGYTVNYLEQSTNNVLHAAKTGTAAFGSTVTESSIAIDGYTAVAASGTVVISSTATNNVINLYYTKNDYGYTVNYLEQGTNNVLHAAKTGTAAFGSTVTESSIAIDGYTAVAASGTVVISSTAANNVINLYYTKNDYGYTVNYLEQGTNNVLHAAKTGTAAFGSTVTENSIAIDGYTAVAASGTVVISSTAANNVINLYYTKNDYGYTVNYLEQGTNNVLHAAKTGTAAFGSTVTESSIAIDGYTAVAASGTVVISSTATNNVINLYYTKNDYGYTVNYLEQGTNNVLHAAKTGTAAFGSTVTESSIAIDGYTAVAASGTVVISSTATSNVINLYYTKNDYGYTVNYLEQGTNNVLHAAKTGTAAFGATVTESSIAIDGYTAVAASGTVVISSTAANNVINLYYTKNDYGYTVNYLEQGTNNVLHAAKTGTAAFGSTVTESSIAIDGYTAVAASGTVVISSTAANNVINLYYTKNDYGYTVNYLEQGTNNVLHAAKTGTAAFGSTVTESSIAIDGYTAVAASGTVVISSTAANNVINLYYTKNDYGYTVNYLEQGTNNVLHAAKTGTAAFGATVTENSIAIDGYTAVAASGTVVISSTATNNVINLYYTKNNYGYTVNYLEQGTNNVLHAAKTGTAAFGSTVTEDAITIDGYTAVKDSDSLVIASDGNVINLYYTENVIIDDDKVPEGDKPVTVPESPKTGDTQSNVPLLSALGGLAAIAIAAAKKFGRHKATEE